MLESGVADSGATDSGDGVYSCTEVCNYPGIIIAYLSAGSGPTQPPLNAQTHKHTHKRFLFAQLLKKNLARPSPAQTRNKYQYQAARPPRLQVTLTNVILWHSGFYYYGVYHLPSKFQKGRPSATVWSLSNHHIIESPVERRGEWAAGYTEPLLGHRLIRAGEVFHRFQVLKKKHSLSL